MAEMRYLDFDLLIERLEEGYSAWVLNSPAGQAAAEFHLPFSDPELEDFLLCVGCTRRGVRRLESPEMQAAKDFGGRLFQTVFDNDVRVCLFRSLDEAERQGAGLRVRLRLAKAPELTDLPWEYLYNPALNRFLVLSAETPVVRYLDLPERIRPLAVEPPLRVLVMISSPSDHPPLNAKQEWEKLKEALGNLEQRGSVALERLEEATLMALQRRLRGGVYHVFHFIGHGGFDERTQDGVLLLEDERRRGHAVSGQYLGTLLHDERTLRLVILNACEGARTSRTDPFAGTAQSLVQQGIPAVIAMQFEITDEAAITLAHEFHTALAEGYPVDAALAEARKRIFGQENDVEWGTPVLYMRSPDGRVFASPLSPEQVGKGLTRLTALMQTPEVRKPVIRFRTHFRAARDRICDLSNFKQLHDSFQELANLYNIIDAERQRLVTDQTAWEGLMLHEPELRGVIGELLNVAARAACVPDDARWTQQLGQARKELRMAIDNSDTEPLGTAARLLRRVLDSEPSRINTRLVAAAGALRLADLVEALSTVQDSLAHPGLNLEAARQFAESVDALAELNDSLITLVSNHDAWQVIDDELRRVEASLGQDLVELELTWPDLKSMTYALYGNSTADWAVSLNEVGADLERALSAAEVPARVKTLFWRYRSQACRRFSQVDSDLLTQCQALQTIGEYLDSLIRTIYGERE